MAEALRWYLALTVAGGAGLLPAAVLFERLRSRGVLYARPLALLLLAYLAWLASNLGVAPYGSGLVAAALALLWIASLAIGWRRRDLLAAIWGQRTLLLVGEALFVALFALFLLVRAQAPDAAHTEKPADLMVLTAVHNAERMPPLDTWYAGERLSYYHLGHTAVDVSARLAAVDLGFTFTLGVATAGALAGAAVFALAGDVLALTPSRRRAGSLRAVTVAGGVAVLSLLVLGTLEGGIELLAANGIGGEGVWGWIGVDGLPPPSGSTGGVPDGFWWWWRATRVVPGTIMEFPAFSLILGDLHPHLLALPLSVLALAVAATAFEGATPLTWRRWLAQPLPLLLSGLLFAGLAMTNSWDAAIYGAIWAAAAVAAGWGIGGAMLGAVRFMLPPVAVALIAAAPFLATIEGGARGIEFVTDSPVDPVPSPDPAPVSAFGFASA
ncbi:MAG: DUF2298 domain-containing protein, partial [Dehalococcoidia bacterium]|nr:DUF2298 domain-containing protein [Dehalococcoidia bacterium]